MKLKGPYTRYAVFITLRLVCIIVCSAPVHNLLAQADQLLRYLQQPRVRALLDTIALAEGTFPHKYSQERGGDWYIKSYQKIFGGQSFSSFDAHPQRVVCVKSRGERLCSSAAGRYQLGATTWKHYMEVRRINRASGDTTFSPLNQDRVAVQIFVDCKILPLLFADPYDFPTIIKKLCKKWASLPDAPYGQPTTYSIEHLERFFKKRLPLYEQSMAVQGVFV